MTPYQGAVVLVNVSAAHNNGQPLAPAIVTAVNPDGTVNVRVQYDAEPSLPGFGRHQRPEHLTSLVFHDTDPATANSQGLYGAFWPPYLQDLTVIIENEEKIMTAQSDVDSAVSAIQAVTADLTAAASAIQAEVASLNSQLAAAGQPAVDTTALNAALAPLQAAQAAVDALKPAAPAPAEPAPAPAPAEGTAGSTVNAGDTGSAA